MPKIEQDISNRLLVARLPTMPQILVKLIELCHRDDTGMDALARLIANDAGIASKILTLANSAAYHRGSSKLGLMQGLINLGMDTIKTLVISESVFQTFNAFPNAGAVDLRCFWKHALTTAILAREISKKMGYAQSEEAYLAGLLHDMGRLALLAAAPKEYTANFHARDNAMLSVIEQQTLQISHTEAGAWLIERWNLDSFLADSVLYHHEKLERVVSAHPLIRIVHLAHSVSSLPAEVPMDPGGGALCGISDADLLAIQQGVAEQVKKTADYLGIDVSGVDDQAVPVAQIPHNFSLPVGQADLMGEVRNMALAAEISVSFSRPKSVAQLLDVVQQNARILFNIENAVMLMKSATSQTLVGVSSGAFRRHLSELAIPLSAGGGIAKAALLNQLVYLEHGPGALSLQEDQLLRLLGADCLVCVPLGKASPSNVVFVGGIPSWQLEDLKQSARLLTSFGSLAGTAMDAINNGHSEMDQLMASVHAEHQENARKVMHEVSNPLAIMKNYIGVIDEKLMRHEPVTRELSILSGEIDRVGSIVDEFSGAPPRIQPGGTEINQLITELVRLFRESKYLPSTVQIVANVADQPCVISGSSDVLKQILVNLIKNAVEAMQKGGQLTVSNLGRVLRSGRLYFEVCVTDTGAGLPAEVLANLYKPVRSSKAGENRGLGLSIVHDKIQKMGGTISCHSTKVGTVFEMYLPAQTATFQRSTPEFVQNVA
jgi:putative nucleotidyltransferase with HDIG domain